MVHVYKKSATPLKPWSVMRSAGANNLRVSGGKYLVLWNAQVVKHEGEWHYVFDFDPQSTLEKPEIARLMAGANGSTTYEGKTDWRAFLGNDFEIVSAKRRNQIIGQGMCTTSEGAVKINCTQLISSPFQSAHYA